MSWLLAEHEGRGLRLGDKDRGPYHRTAGRVPDKSNSLIFFSFSMVPMYIYLENLEHRLNTMRLALCLAMGSERMIAKHRNSLLGLSLNCFDANSLCLPFSLEPVYFILRHFWWGGLWIWKKHQHFLHFSI